MTAEVARYERMTTALATLTELASDPAEARLAALLTGDEVVLARMRAAAAVLATAPADLPGLEDLRDCTEADLLDAATGWQRYARSLGARGPVGDLRRACAVDMARGMVRLWAGRRGSPATGPLARRVRLRQARIALLGRVRVRCAALRTELRDDAAALAGRRAGSFVDHVALRVAEVAAELTDEVDWELPGGPDSNLPDVAVLPSPHRAGELRLTGLLGAAFGLGAALTVVRMLFSLMPGYTGAAVGVGIAVGLGLGGWVVAARRLLARRAALDRWVTEVTAGLRAALEERVAVRALAAEAAEAHRADADRRGPRPV